MKLKSKKSALVLSFVSVMLCVAMLVGSTFAWFTDTASANVNQIQSGNLDVDIVNEAGTSIDGGTLSFKNVEGSADILWEPGAKFALDSFKIVNNGNLALKYTVTVNGLTGDAKLLEVIDFTVKVGSSDEVKLADLNGKLLPEGADSADGDVKETGLITIYGKMKETAGNEYKNLSIDGISIKVNATQATYEKDSISDQYDKNADHNTQSIEGGKVFESGSYTLDTGITAIGANAVAVLAKDGANITITDGYFDGGEGGDNVCVWAETGSTVTIQGGTFTVGCDAKGGANSVIYAYGGKIIIEGGFFYTDYQYDGKYYVLNQNNSTPGSITVKGGTFVNFDPSQGDDNLGGSFVPSGYSVISETKANGDIWYTVVKGSSAVVGTQDDMNDAITDSTERDVTLQLKENTSVTLDNGLANVGSSRNVTFIGNGTQTVDVITNAVNAEGGQLNYQRGSTFSFENTTIKAGEGSFDGIVCDELTFKNCTIKGKLTLYGKATFINCKFENTMENQYSIWTWGGTDVSLTGCTFNTNGKAILLYGRATAEKPTNLTVENCTFNDRKDGAAGKAAIEIGNDYNATYTLTIKDITVNGFAEGKNTGSKLWANKNSMDAEHLTVTIDGNQQTL